MNARTAARFEMVSLFVRRKLKDQIARPIMHSKKIGIAKSTRSVAFIPSGESIGPPQR